MPTLRNHIHHVFGGGWMTDFGPTALHLAPDQAGRIVIPFLLNAEDALFELSGGVHKVHGTTRINSTALESGATVKAFYDYWQQGTLDTAAQHRVVFVNDRIYTDDANGTFTSRASGLAVGAVPHMTQFDDILIMTNDATADVPRSWDGTTFQNLAGSPPNFSFSTKHKNWHWAAGVHTNPSHLYYSAQLNPEDWTGGTSGSIQVDPNDGDRITGISSFKDELWVFKGPHKGSIHRVTGTSNSDWARTTFIEGVGAVWQNTITKFQDDLAFMWNDGSIRTLKATSAFGDYGLVALSTPIQSWLTSHLNFNRLRHAWMSASPDGNKLYLAIPIDSSSDPNIVLVLDARFNPPRWSSLPSYEMTALGLGLDPDASDRPVLYFGDEDGFLKKGGQSARSIDGVTALSYKVTTPHFDYGVPEMMKTFEGVGLGFQPKNDGSVTFGWTRDNNAQQTQAISQRGSDVLGTASANQFTLGTSQLGGARFVNSWYDLETGGEFRSVAFEITNSVINEDVELHSIEAFITPGAESTEN